jgi:hypothetical protein
LITLVVHRYLDAKNSLFKGEWYANVSSAFAPWRIAFVGLIHVFPY